VYKFEICKNSNNKNQVISGKPLLKQHPCSGTTSLSIESHNRTMKTILLLCVTGILSVSCDITQSIKDQQSKIGERLLACLSGNKVGCTTSLSPGWQAKIGQEHIEANINFAIRCSYDKESRAMIDTEADKSILESCAKKVGCDDAFDYRPFKYEGHYPGFFLRRYCGMKKS